MYSCPGNLVDKGPWRVTVHGVAKELGLKQQQSLDASATSVEDCTAGRKRLKTQVCHLWSV